MSKHWCAICNGDLIKIDGLPAICPSEIVKAPDNRPPCNCKLADLVLRGCKCGGK